jgi:UPF0755 protein
MVLFVHFLNVPVIQKEDFHYVLKSGTSASIFTRDLVSQTDLKFPKLFLLLVGLLHDGKYLRAGEYVFPVDSKPLNILNRVVSGKVVYHKFTIIEGWSYKELMQAMNQNTSIKHVLSNDSAQVVAQKLGVNRKTPEGLLLPDTYCYTLNTTDLELLQWAYQSMKDYMGKAWADRDKTFKYENTYQALIVASMIEKETAVHEEKPLIAAVILKRLKRWIPLQIDATVIYGLQDRNIRKLTKQDLHTKTPYNTYIKYGLPPTPISMPSEDSIQAALHPAKTDVLYFVAKRDGHHEFSKSLKQHNSAVKKYVLN